VTRHRSWRCGAGALVTVALVVLSAGAMASAMTLAVADNASVTNVGGTSTRANIVVNTHAHAVYALSGDSAHHPKCTSSTCRGVWPPATVKSSRSLRLAHGISGHLAVWHHNGLLQLTLNGHPLYTFSGDSRARQATGEGITSFGGTWHVLTPNGKNVSFAKKKAASPAPMAPSCTTGLCY
jgi:predicted lipoprotein with Yx(FWY)xxD motif